MKKLILLTSVAIVILGITIELHAEEVSCPAGKKSCGENCCYDTSIDKNGDKVINFSRIDENKTATITHQFVDERRGLKDITIPAWVTSIGNFAFHYVGINSLTMPDSVTNIGDQAFALNSISTVKMPDSLISIGDSAFAYAGIGNITWGNSLTSIGNSAFRNNNITQIIIPDSVTNIGNYAFYDTNLSYVTIPESVTHIGVGAFALNDIQYVVITDALKANMFEHSGLGLPKKIICQGNVEKCKNMFKSYKRMSGEIVDISDRVVQASEIFCKDKNYFWNGAECLREPDVTKRQCCADVCKDMGGWCNRIRYTPAEAAQVLRNDNTNEVTITFRK